MRADGILVVAAAAWLLAALNAFSNLWDATLVGSIVRDGHDTALVVPELVCLPVIIMINRFPN